MTPEHWQQVEEVFQSALDRSPDERQRFIAEACAHDADLRAQVEALVSQHEAAGDFIEAPAFDFGRLNYEDTPFVAPPATVVEADPMAGRRIGAYKLVREIGRGGMGAVYLAVRADSEFQKRVAIKLIKRGMDTDFILRRFRNERQILASLDHPYIARLLDGGTTDDGLPYFVMEYIDGQPLYSYCDGQKLTIAERLRLFSHVCGAVQYAHQNLVVHRDIKPGNILVCSDGTPKLLDFGIAKLLNPELTPDTITPTATAMRLMTPEYASPEQVQGLSATPASDVYSLGVLLYELLTGHRPYHFRSRAPHEIARVICEEEPEHPSHAIALSQDIVGPEAARSDAATLEFVYRNRGTTLEELRRELTGDLDNIVLKALRKEPGRRYASAEKLRQDIARHLEGRPISAPFFFPVAGAATRPMSAAAAAAEKSIAVLPFKIIGLQNTSETGDNFLGVGLADALITRLSSLRQCVVRPTSSVLRYGDGEADPFSAGHELGVKFVLDGHIRRAGARIRVTVQLLSVGAGATVWASQFDEDFTDVLSLEDALSTQVAEALVPQLTGDERLQLAKRGTDNAEAYETYLRGRYYWNTFTEDGFAKAITNYYRAIALDPTYAAAFTGVAEYYIWLGIYGVLPPAECFAAAKEAATKAVELDDTLAEAHTALGLAIHTADFQWSAAEEHFRRALELNPNYSTAHLWYSLQLAMEGRFDESLQSARRALELDPLTPFNRHNVGWCLYHARRFDESLEHYRQWIADEPDYGMAHHGYGWVLRQVGKSEESVAEAAKAVEMFGDTPFIIAALAASFAAAGKVDVVHKILRQLEEVSTKRYVSPYHLALVYCYLNDKEQALTLLEQTYADHDAWIVWLGVEPQFDVLRDEARFVDLLRRTNNPASKRREANFSGSVAQPENIQTGSPTAAVVSNPIAEQLVTDSLVSRHTVGAAQQRRRLPAFLAVSLLVVLLAAAGLTYWQRPRQSPFPGPSDGKPLRLTNNPATDWHPAYSPDGSRIAFASNREGNFEIYVADPDGTNPRRLTHNSAEDVAPVWSLDATRIAFTSKRDGNDEVYVMNADGGNQTNVSRHPAADSRAAWSPDGQKLVFVSNRDVKPDTYDIYLMADGGGQTRLTDDPAFDGDPVWSPDGARIAFASNRSGDFEIYTIGIDGRGLSNVSNNPAFDGKPAWSPDGSKLAFTSNREAGDFEIYVMEADGRWPRRLTNNNMIDDEPKWSPDGNLIVYQTQIDGNFELFTNSVKALLSRPSSGNTTGIRALAVLPLATLGATGDEQYLGVGIADMLINKLGQLDEMTLRTPAAVRRYLGTTKTALEAGRELGVDYVLAGSVERVGDRVRASLELTGTAEGRVMWAEQFDERFTDIPALQSSISERVARALSLELTSDERRRLGKRDTEDSEAHQLYLAGRYHLGKRTAEGLRQAITNFESAIARDSRFALAHAGLADCYALLNWYVEPPPADAFARARQAALRAVEYDDNLAEAHASLAFVKFHYERDWTGAELEFRRAINLNPLYPTAHHWYAFYLSAANRHDDAIAEMRRAAELDPRSAVIATALANVLYHAKRYDEAIEQCQQALRLDPGSVAAHVVLRWTYEKKGQHDAAYAVYEKERAFAGDTPTTRAKLAHVLAAAKRTAEARTVLNELLASPRQRGAVTPYEIAVIYSLLDDKENALVWLEQAAKGHAVGFSFVRVDPHLDNLRADSRFAELLRANGFGD